LKSHHLRGLQKKSLASKKEKRSTSLKNKTLGCRKINLINHIIFFIALLPSSIFSRDVLEISDQIRETTFKQTTIAASKETLYAIDYNLSSEEIIKACNKQGQGLWCAGIAFVYYLKLKEAGIHSYILSVGFPDEFTHAAVLVNLGSSYIIQDPYLNYMIEDNYLSMLKKIKKNIKPKIKFGVNQFRPVAAAEGCSSWALKELNPAAPIRKVGKTSIFMSKITLDNFSKYYKSEKAKKSFDRLHALNIPQEYIYFYLFPFAIFGIDGYTEDKNSELNHGLLKTFNTQSQPDAK